MLAEDTLFTGLSAFIVWPIVIIAVVALVFYFWGKRNG